MKFRVINRTTGKAPDLEKIALEEWTKCLWGWADLGFALFGDGDLVLMDEDGKFAYCPEDRFQILLDWGKAGHQEPGVVFQNDEFRVKGKPGDFKYEAMNRHDDLEEDLLEAVLTALAGPEGRGDAG